MSRIPSILVCFAVASVISFGAQAFPVSPAPAIQVGAPEFTLVRGFCGLGFHRGPYGGCVRNGVPYGYVAPRPTWDRRFMQRHRSTSCRQFMGRRRWSCRAHVPTATTSMLPTAAACQLPNGRNPASLHNGKGPVVTGPLSCSRQRHF